MPTLGYAPLPPVCIKLLNTLETAEIPSHEPFLVLFLIIKHIHGNNRGIVGVQIRDEAYE